MTHHTTDMTVPVAERRTGSFAAMVALTILTAPFFPGAAFVGPLVAFATPVRASRRMMTVLWVLASIITALYVILLVAAVTDHWPSWLMFDSEEYATV